MYLWPIYLPLKLFAPYWVALSSLSICCLPFLIVPCFVQFSCHLSEACSFLKENGGVTKCKVKQTLFSSDNFWWNQDDCGLSSHTYQDDSSKLTSSINPSQIDQKEINDFSWTQFISALKSKLYSPWSSTLAKILHLISFQLAND